MGPTHTTQHVVAASYQLDKELLWSKNCASPPPLLLLLLLLLPRWNAQLSSPPISPLMRAALPAVVPQTQRLPTESVARLTEDDETDKCDDRYTCSCMMQTRYVPSNTSIHQLHRKTKTLIRQTACWPKTERQCLEAKP
ncbi:uncharacterized protein V6R79_014244 [Siganus canaliculatus]